MEPLNDVGTLEKPIWTPVRLINDFMKLENNINILKDKKAELIAALDGILRHRTSFQVSALLRNVDILDIKVRKIVRSFGQSRSNFIIKLKLIKQVLKVTQKVDRLLHETRQLTNELLAPQLLFGKATVEKNMEAILESLRDPSVHKIGIYGMTGSRKTATMNNISNYLATTTDFDKIIWVSVTKDYNLDRVRKEITQQLDWNLNSEGKYTQRSSWLLERLKQANKFLIIFDDMWESISLKNVGIPEPNRKNKCKIVLTTRSLAVCHRMGSDKKFKLNLLTEDDAWEYFVSKAGNEVLGPEVVPLAKKVVHECDGLPLAINTIGISMRNQVKISTCRQVLEFLRSSPKEIQGMETIFHSLLLSYSHLRNDTARKCFLYLAVFPKDYQIEANELVRYWIADRCIPEIWLPFGMIDRVYFQSKLYEGFTIMRELINACLFEESSTGHIKMHSVTRWFANNILTENYSTLAKAGLSLSQSPSINEWKKPNRISFAKNMIQFLPDQPNCPNLSVLILRENPLSHNIVSSFFSQMPAITFLDLSHTGISELPSSLSELLNLHALFLQECTSLEKIPPLAKLEKLQELNLFHTAIKELPQGMEGLISLRTLDLSYTHQLQNLTFPLPSLLEEFCMQGSKLWSMDSPTVSKSIKEIICLDRIAILSLSFVRLQDYLDAFICLPWEMLKSYSIRISHTVDLPDMDYNKHRQNFVHICNQQMFSHSSTLVLPPYTQELNITLCDIPRLSNLSCLKNRFLRKCYIGRCSLSSGGCLILGDEMKENTFMKTLEHFSLENIRGLTTLWTGVVHNPCFSNLRVLEVQWCGCLKTLFCINILNHLKSIEVIKVKECKLLQEIVQGPYEEGNEEDSPNTYDSPPTGDKIEVLYQGRQDDNPDIATTTIDLPSLNTFILHDLPELHTISRITWACASLRHVEVFNCSRLKKLPFNVESLPRLGTIKGESKWWETLEWNDTQTKNFPQLRFEHTEQINLI